MKKGIILALAALGMLLAGRAVVMAHEPGDGDHGPHAVINHDKAGLVEGQDAIIATQDAGPGDHGPKVK